MLDLESKSFPVILLDKTQLTFEDFLLKSKTQIISAFASIPVLGDFAKRFYSYLGGEEIIQNFDFNDGVDLLVKVFFFSILGFFFTKIKEKKDFERDTFDMLLQNPHDIMIFFDNNLDVFSSNLKIIGQEAEFALEYMLQPEGKAILNRVINTGEKFFEEIVNIEMDFYKTILIYPIYGLNKDNETIRYIAVKMRDIKERILREKELKKALNLNRILFDSIPAPMYLIDIKTKKIIDKNKAGVELLKNGSDYCWKALYDGNYISEGNLKHFESTGEALDGTQCDFCKAQDAINTGLPQSMEIKLKGRDYQAIWVPVDDELFLHFFRDITELKEKQKTLEESKDKAEKMAQSIKEFMVSLIHDINTILNGLLHIPGLFRDSLDEMNLSFQSFETDLNDITESLKNIDPQYFPIVKDKLLGISQSIMNLDFVTFNDALDNMDQKIKSIHNIIRDILHLAKLESGKVEFIEGNEFNLKFFLNKYDSLVQKSGVEFEVQVSDDIPDVLIGNELFLNRIFTNLIGNAIKFTDKGKISIFAKLKTMQEGKIRVDFVVKDTGIGMNEKDLPYIFECFHQGDCSMKKCSSGSVGLGLALVKKLVDVLGGEIDVNSKKGKGSEFIVSLPFDTKD